MEDEEHKEEQEEPKVIERKGLEGRGKRYLTIKVMDQEGRPLPDLLVKLYRRAVAIWEFAGAKMTNASGVAKFEKIPRGLYTAVIKKGNKPLKFYVMTGERLIPHFSERKEKEVKAIVLEGVKGTKKKLHVIPLDRNAKVPPFVRVHLFKIFPEPQAFASTLGGNPILFDNLDPGTYLIIIESDMYETVFRKVNVALVDEVFVRQSLEEKRRPGNASSPASCLSLLVASVVNVTGIVPAIPVNPLNNFLNYTTDKP